MHLNDDKQRYLFFLRAFNDIDNIAPAIYFLLKEAPAVYVDIVIYSFDYPFKGDKNLQYLQDIFWGRVRVQWIGEYMGMQYKQYHRAGLLGTVYRDCQLLRLQEWKKRIRYPYRKVQALRYRRDKVTIPDMRSSVYYEATRNFIRDGSPPVLAVFDQNRDRHIVCYVDALRDAGTKRVISLPVSPFINVNVLRSVNIQSPDPRKLEPYTGYSCFDAIGQTDGFYASFLERLYQHYNLQSPFARKIRILGSIRFCPEWIQIRKNIFPPSPVRETAKNGCRLVFFLSDIKTNTNYNELLTTIKILGEFSDIEVIIKPHTRSMTFDLKSLPSHISINSEAASSDLIEWADFVLFWGTSVAIEAYMKEKVCLCLNYIHANKNNYASHNAGWVLSCRDDLVDALFRLRKNPEEKPYNEDNVQLMLTNIVYGGDRSMSVPERYCSFLQQMADSKHSIQGK